MSNILMQKRNKKKYARIVKNKNRHNAYFVIKAARNENLWPAIISY